MQISRYRFTWSDALVLASIGGGSDVENGARLEDLICNSDVLNHAILGLDEIRDGLRHLHGNGRVLTSGVTIYLTNHGREVYENGSRRRGGLFSLVDNMQKTLNSPRIKHPEIESEINLGFITSQSLAVAYQAYSKRSQDAAKSLLNQKPKKS